jgi:hypothetical protein
MSSRASLLANLDFTIGRGSGKRTAVPLVLTFNWSWTTNNP